ncbi:hypothetical protein E2C01_073715 [Portunus trituberculatus]|uniref:Uncharacterized protein n=1 Tax=Portunus trituberculatus TaxID=210409 RepID=A0A5B7I3Q8_PORTR|nr:hypothetical protein [Portunus trituberculatus]
MASGFKARHANANLEVTPEIEQILSRDSNEPIDITTFKKLKERDRYVEKLKSPQGGYGVVDKVVSVGSIRRPRVGSNPTTYRFEAMPFVEWFKVTYTFGYTKDALGW